MMTLETIPWGYTSERMRMYQSRRLIINHFFHLNGRESYFIYWRDNKGNHKRWDCLSPLEAQGVICYLTSYAHKEKNDETG